MRLGKFLLVFSIVGIIAAITTIVIITYYIPSLSGDKNFIFFFAFSMMLLAPLIASVMNCAIVTQTSSYKLYQ
jgi:ABC-type multidrug transport system permease subunit